MTLNSNMGDKVGDRTNTAALRPGLTSNVSICPIFDKIMYLIILCTVVELIRLISIYCRLSMTCKNNGKFVSNAVTNYSVYCIEINDCKIQ